MTELSILWDVRRRGGFRRNGFRGFAKLGDAVRDRAAFLEEHRREFIEPGVYAIFAPPDWRVTWRSDGLENVIAPWPPAHLTARWVEDVELVYIGCAGRTASSRILRKRIGDLLKHGAGKLSSSGPHKGGERVWQCAGWQQFVLAWKATGPYPEPHNLEVAIGLRFALLAGRLPFANERL